MDEKTISSDEEYRRVLVRPEKDHLIPDGGYIVKKDDEGEYISVDKQNFYLHKTQIYFIGKSGKKIMVDQSYEAIERD